MKIIWRFNKQSRALPLVLFCIAILGADLITANSATRKLDQNKSGSAFVLPQEAILGGPFGGLDLRISANQRFICFFKKADKNDGAGLFRGVGKYVILDTQNGRMQNIEQLIKDEPIFGLSGSSGEPEFSPAADYLLIHAIPDLNTSAPCGINTLLFVVNLETKHVTKFKDNYFGGGKWVGHSIAIATGDDQEINAIKIIDVEENKTRSLAVCGLVVAADPGGKFLMVQANPDKLASPIPWKQTDKQFHLLVIDLRGKIIKDLGKEPSLIDKAVISPHGKYAMYKADSGGGTHIRIFSIDKGRNRIVNENKTFPTSVIPLCITDEGLSATCNWELEANPSGRAHHEMKLDFVITGRDANRNSWRLLSGKPIVSAAGTGDLLYFVEVAENGIGKLYHMPLKELIESRSF